MIILSGSPAEVGVLEKKYPAGGIERGIVETMLSSTKKYEFKLPEEFDFMLRMRSATVKAAVDLYNSGMEFEIFRKSRCNSAFWERTDDGGFRLKPGASPAAGILDIFQNGHLYATECATAIIIVYYRAVLTLFPPKLFDQMFPEIVLMNWHSVDPLFRGVGLLKEYKDYFPGDRQYFRNPDVNPKTPEWQGENVIILVGGKYYGHGLGIYDEQEIIRELNNNRVEDAENSAYLMNGAGRPDYSKLYAVLQGGG